VGEGMKIEAVTFDVGGTLIEPWPSVGHVYAEVATLHGIRDVTPELLDGRFRTAWRARKDFLNTRVGWREVVDEVFAGLAIEPPGVTFFSELYERFAQADAWRVFDDVLPALDLLRSRRIRLAVISNWDERLRILLGRLGLDRHFETIVISCEAGCSKPASAIFERAATEMQLEAETILHVGDNVEADVLGARSAGFHARRIRRGNAAPSECDVASLIELGQM